MVHPENRLLMHYSRWALREGALKVMVMELLPMGRASNLCHPFGAEEVAWGSNIYGLVGNGELLGSLFSGLEEGSFED